MIRVKPDFVVEYDGIEQTLEQIITDNKALVKENEKLHQFLSAIRQDVTRLYRAFNAETSELDVAVDEITTILEREAA